MKKKNGREEKGWGGGGQPVENLPLPSFSLGDLCLKPFSHGFVVFLKCFFFLFFFLVWKI